MEKRGGGGVPWTIVLVMVCFAVVALAVVIGDPTERATSEAIVMAQRALVKEVGRQAAHERMMEMIPVMVLCVGGLLVGLAMALIAWDVARSRPARDERLLAYLQRLELAQAERDREMWRVLAKVSRVRIPRSVTVEGMARQDRSNIV